MVKSAKKEGVCLLNPWFFGGNFFYVKEGHWGKAGGGGVTPLQTKSSLILRREYSGLTIAQDCRMWPVLVSNWKFFKYFCLNSNSSALLYFSMTQVLDLRAIGIYLSLKQYFFIWFKNFSMVSEGDLELLWQTPKKTKKCGMKSWKCFWSCDGPLKMIKSFHEYWKA